MSIADTPRRFRISIAAASMACFGGLVFVGVFAVLGLGFRTAAVNTRPLLGDKATLTIDLLNTELRRRVDAVVSGNLFLAGLIREGRFDSHNRRPLMGHMRAAMAATPLLPGMGYLTPDLSITRVAREAGAATPHMGDVSHVPRVRRVLARSKAGDKPIWGKLMRSLIDQGGGADVGSQEREITVMFTDIAGFTALAQRMTAADAATLLNEQFFLFWPRASRPRTALWTSISAIR